MTAISLAPGASGLVTIFALDQQRFGLDIAVVQRVIRVVEITPLPDAPPSVLGIINVHGRIIPVLDLRRRFRFPAREIALSDHLLITQTAHRTIAILVDAVIGVIEWNASMVVPAGDILPDFTEVLGVVKLEGDIVLIHDLEKFLSHHDSHLLDRALEPEK